MAEDTRAILFLGDIHGCLQELENLLKTAGFTAGRHRCIPLGDVVNRGPDSKGSLRLLEEIGAEPILGNHEASLLRSWRSGQPEAWMQGRSSAWEALDCGDAASPRMRQISHWPAWREGRDWLAVHAGVHPCLSLAETPLDFLLYVRHCDAQGCLPTQHRKPTLRAPRGYRAWFYHYRGKKTVLFGHWAWRGLVHTRRCWGLDTGCLYGKKLTGLWWPDAQLVQTPALKIYRDIRP